MIRALTSHMLMSDDPNDDALHPSCRALFFVLIATVA
jgi:hypothetical protein